MAGRWGRPPKGQRASRVAGSPTPQDSGGPTSDAWPLGHQPPSPCGIVPACPRSPLRSPASTTPLLLTPQRVPGPAPTLHIPPHICSPTAGASQPPRVQAPLHALRDPAPLRDGTCMTPVPPARTRGDTPDPSLAHRLHPISLPTLPPWPSAWSGAPLTPAWPALSHSSCCLTQRDTSHRHPAVCSPCAPPGSPHLPQSFTRPCHCSARTPGGLQCLSRWKPHSSSDLVSPPASLSPAFPALPSRRQASGLQQGPFPLPDKHVGPRQTCAHTPLS